MSAVSGTRAAAGRLRDYLQRRRGEMRDLLERLVRAELPSTVPAAQEPVLDLLENALMERGYRIHRLRGHRTGGHLFATPGNRSKNQLIQLLIGHCDTVWPLGTLDTMPVRCRDGKLYGPGAYDMKAGLVQGIFALEALKVLDLQPGVAPVFFINSDEEIGSGESTPQIRRLARSANRAFVLEPSLGPKGKLKTQRKGVGRFIVRSRRQGCARRISPGTGGKCHSGTLVRNSATLRPERCRARDHGQCRNDRRRYSSQRRRAGKPCRGRCSSVAPRGRTGGCSDYPGVAAHDPGNSDHRRRTNWATPDGEDAGQSKALGTRTRGGVRSRHRLGRSHGGRWFRRQHHQPLHSDLGWTWRRRR